MMNDAGMVRRLHYARVRSARIVFASKDGGMEDLRWWLFLLTALMFSMSG